MTQEDKELLLKDLCARLPYGVKVQCGDYLFTFDKDHMGIGLLYKDFNMNLLESPKIILNGCYYGEDIKPYLFPISSITEKQRNDVSKILIDTQNKFPHYGAINSNGFDNLFICITNQANAFINYCLEHHLDINGLIPKGLAIDATGLNIY